MACSPLAVHANGGRLLATGGATQIEGAAGGGLVPWAVLAGYGTREQQGGTAFYTRVDTGDYALGAAGVAWTFNNRPELSLARQKFDLVELQQRLSLPVGARDGAGTDIYLSASKLFLDAAGGQQLLLNATLRSTAANQMDLLGHGGDRASRSLVWEGSVAWLPHPSWAQGLEYRQKPDHLGFAAEADWADAFVAWFPNKHVAVVAAWADLGSIAGLDGQRGGYVSLQLSH